MRASATLVLDIGKTNVKLLVLSKAGAILDVARMDNHSLDGPPYPHLDTERIWQWLLQSAAAFARGYAIDAIVPTTHGCTAGLVDGSGLVLPILDYEAEVPAAVTQAYAALMPSFAETQTPDLPGGQNLGRQLLWLQRDFARQFERARWILTYPQYWSWRLSGVAASEVSSIGCHGHLWNPQKRCYSSLAEDQGWVRLLPPLRPAWAALGPLLPEIARTTGLAPTCRVYNGIHDSNAAYALYLRGHPAPFCLVSTGTWVIMMSPRLPLAALDEARDTLSMVSVLGEPLPTARYMGGREFEILSAEAGAVRECSEADLRRVIEKRSFLLPAFAPGGPFMGRRGAVRGAPVVGSGEIIARATLYAALMTATSTRMLEIDGDLMVDGGFVNNTWYCRLLATLAGSGRCFVNHQTEGTAVGAGMLAVWDERDIAWPLNLSAVEKFADPGLAAYVEAWQRALAG